MDGCSGERRDLEVSFSVIIPQDPLPRCAVHTEVTPSFPAAEGCCTAFSRDPHCQHCGAFSLAWKGSTALVLGAVEKRLEGIRLLRVEG